MPEIERDEGMYMNEFLQERKIAHGEYDFIYWPKVNNLSFNP